MNGKSIRILLCLGLLAGLLGCAREAEKADLPVIPVVMKKYSIAPEVIRLKQGQEVLLSVTTADVQHGFDVPELGIKESVQKGQTAKIRLKVDRTGEFKIECGVMCGPGHDDMTGKIVVE